jgi:hypothetical protein
MNPLKNDITRCMGKFCDEKDKCMRYLTIDLDTQPYQWFMDASVEMIGKCDFKIEVDKTCN